MPRGNASSHATCPSSSSGHSGVFHLPRGPSLKRRLVQVTLVRPPSDRLLRAAPRKDLPGLSAAHPARCARDESAHRPAPGARDSPLISGTTGLRFSKGDRAGCRRGLRGTVDPLPDLHQEAVILRFEFEFASERSPELLPALPQCGANDGLARPAPPGVGRQSAPLIGAFAAPGGSGRRPESGRLEPRNVR